jgi:hypothetical protein
MPICPANLNRIAIRSTFAQLIKSKSVRKMYLSLGIHILKNRCFTIRLPSRRISISVIPFCQNVKWAPSDFGRVSGSLRDQRESIRLEWTRNTKANLLAIKIICCLFVNFCVASAGQPRSRKRIKHKADISTFKWLIRLMSFTILFHRNKWT